jgi:hypothetical protein
MYIWLILEALGLTLELKEDPVATERLKSRSDWLPVKRKSKRRWHLDEIAIARRRRAPWLWDSARARQAALMRWHKPEVTEIAG